MSRLINDVTAVRMLLGPGILNFVNTPVYYAYAISIMLTLDVRLTIAALLPYPLLAAGGEALQPAADGAHLARAAGPGRDEQPRAGEPQRHPRRARLRQRGPARPPPLPRSTSGSQEQSMQLARVRGQILPVMKTAASLGTLVVLWYGGVEVVNGRLSLGDLVAFIGYLNLLAWPTMAMGWMLSVLQRGRAAMSRLDHIFDAQPSICDPPDAAPLAAIEGRIEFRNVDFAYRTAGNGHQVLDRRLLPYRARSEAGAGRAHGGGQEHGRDAAAAAVRRQRRPDLARRPRHPHAAAGAAAAQHRFRTARSVSVLHHGARQHLLRTRSGG